MRVVVGSKNPAKISAVREALFPLFLKEIQLDVEGIEVPSGVSDQPIGLDAIYSGARNRAQNAWRAGINYSVGLESGLTVVPGEETARMNSCVCAIYDGNRFEYGVSSGFLIPKRVAHLIHNDGLQLDEALHRLQITKSQRVGYEAGFIGALTNGKVTRQIYTEQAVCMAIVPFLNKELFSEQ